MFKIGVLEKTEPHILCPITIFFFENCATYEILWKDIGVAGQSTDDNMGHVLHMPGNYSYRHTLRIYDTYCFPTATMVTRTRLNVTLYEQCQSPFNISVVSRT
jgi:hypothetical protein